MPRFPEQELSKGVFKPIAGIPLVSMNGVSAVVLRSISSLPSHEKILLTDDLELLLNPESVEKIIEREKQASDLRKRSRRFTESNPAETWASRCIASPIAYLFPELRREEWLGDLYETNREMLLKSYPRWVVNVNNILRTIALVESGLRTKLQEWFSLWKQIR